MNQDKKALFSEQTTPIWLRIVVIFMIGLGIFFRFDHLGQKPYWLDESFTSLAISGYTVAEVQQEVSNGHIIPVKALDKYQRINSEHGVRDTIRFLITSDPQHPPLYFIFARLWAQAVGDSPAAVRSLSALLSLLLFLSVYWLCLELFKTPSVGWVALGIVAVSPLHLLYAQEARPYCLWSVTIALSSATLLQARRCDTLGSWSLYALSLVIGLYTHLLTALVMIAHGIYVLVLERFRFNKTFINYLLSTLAALFLFLPWLIILLTHINEAKSFVAWLSFLRLNSFDLIAIWLTRTSRIFFDINLGTDIAANTKFLSESPFWYGLATIIISLSLMVYICYFLLIKYVNKISLFIFLLGGTTVLFLILPDLILGGVRSIQFRLELPFYLSLQLAVAYVLAFHVASENRWRKRLCQLLIVGVFLLGLASDTMIYKSDTWWTKAYGTQQLQKAKVINQSDNPLLISSGSRFSLANFLCISHYLDTKVRFIVTTLNNQQTSPEANSNIFIVDNLFELYIDNNNLK